jgi:hypothetical protein
MKLQVPGYALEMLWLTDEKGTAMPLSEAKKAAPPMTLRWGHAEGTPLTQWTQPKQTWDGSVRVRGHLEAAHYLEADELMVLEVRGTLITATERRFPTLEDLRQPAFQREPSFYVETSSPSWYAFLLPLDSLLVDFAQQALVGRHLTDCYGALAHENTGFQHLLGMPLLLNSLTVYG